MPNGDYDYNFDTDVLGCENALGMAVPCSDAEIGESFWQMMNSWQDIDYNPYQGPDDGGWGGTAGGMMGAGFNPWNWWQQVLYPFWNAESGPGGWIAQGDAADQWQDYDLEPGYDFDSWMANTGTNLGPVFSMEEGAWIDPTLSFLAQCGDIFANLGIDETSMWAIGQERQAQIDKLKEDYLYNLYGARQQGTASGFSGMGSGINQFNSGILDDFSQSVESFYQQEQADYEDVYAQFGANFMDMIYQLVEEGGFLSQNWEDMDVWQGDQQSEDIPNPWGDEYMGFYDNPETDLDQAGLANCLAEASSPTEWGNCWGA